MHANILIELEQSYFFFRFVKKNNVDSKKIRKIFFAVKRNKRKYRVESFL